MLSFKQSVNPIPCRLQKAFGHTSVEGCYDKLQQGHQHRPDVLDDNLNLDLLNIVHLMWDILTDWVGDLSLLSFSHIHTFLVWLLLTSSRYGDPDLVIALSLPPEVALLAVLHLTLRLYEGLQLWPEGLSADGVVLSVALVVVHGVALRHHAVHAHHVGLRHTEAAVLRLALLRLQLLVVRGPGHRVLQAAVDARLRQDQLGLVESGGGGLGARHHHQHGEHLQCCPSTHHHLVLACNCFRIRTY